MNDFAILLTQSVVSMAESKIFWKHYNLLAILASNLRLKLIIITHKTKNITPFIARHIYEHN
uniref:Uncharacterized protein n=1 Tax=OCS116 cluster bacterium TaxID=2030921 RepID=A0A2A4Z7N5_9PROT